MSSVATLHLIGPPEKPYTLKEVFFKPFTKKEAKDKLKHLLLPVPELLLGVFITPLIPICCVAAMFSVSVLAAAAGKGCKLLGNETGAAFCFKTARQFLYGVSDFMVAFLLLPLTVLTMATRSIATAANKISIF